MNRLQLSNLYLKMFIKTRSFNFNDAVNVIQQTNFPFAVQLAIAVYYLADKLYPRNTYLQMVFSYLLMITIVKRAMEIDHTADRSEIAELMEKGEQALAHYQQTNFPATELFSLVHLLGKVLRFEIDRLEIFVIPWGKF